MADEGILTRELLRHRDALFAYALVLTRDPHAAEDAFQDLGLAVAEAATQDLAVEHFSAWAQSVLRHRIIDRHRRESRHQRHRSDPALLAEVAAQAFDEAAGAGELDDAEALLGRLAAIDGHGGGGEGDALHGRPSQWISGCGV